MSNELSEEQKLFINILENQRNAATTELARVAARNAVLEQQIAHMLAAATAKKTE